ncbi:Fe2+-dependent dioxygenase [Balneatrix alpica]|uniref:Fe2+-dependent dioxygenase n=1 Tax=Balneatrix alpica TaxID=75684 RepID=UPI0027392F03|nr:Fe2+-dependent dioxygenase [Balneatrix alpica]
MIYQISQLFSATEVSQLRQHLDQANWVDGKLSAGSQAQAVKANLQLAQDDPLAQQIGDLILDRLAQHPRFVATALPQKIYPPMFNCYHQGGHYGAHVDNAIRVIPRTPVRLRTDLSATLFLAEPDQYQGGEMQIDDSYGSHLIKLQAGDMILYPSTSVHQVHPVTQGKRVCAFFWIQSMVRSHTERHLLVEVDNSIRELSQQLHANHPEVIRLSRVYQNLLQHWVET